MNKRAYIDQISEEYLGVVWQDNPTDIRNALSAAFDAGWGLGITEANERDHYNANEN